MKSIFVMRNPLNRAIINDLNLRIWQEIQEES